MASSNMSLPIFKPYFHGRNFLSSRPTKLGFTTYKPQSPNTLRPCAKFNLSEILGGRGLCNGEEGILKELKKNVEEITPLTDDKEEEKPESLAISGTEEAVVVPEEGFDKELMGLTGGFPGGEKGLKLFIEKNPPPAKPSVENKPQATSLKKSKAPDMPMLLPGMIAIVSNQNSPYYMYCGIVQRITDGKAGVLFEGGNWDRLITFRLEELQRRDKGPPGKNPKSCILEPLLQKDSE
ncbi:NAD(P)H-quinone oxidoreductase subunit S, chloroplastic [Humulus lupulus]|uniref:NAD(P)H-quinone oxidoreductase subunit S, chloroplastic n=1 Tax=Humulus lupulus TaxID=3486 RepID=UPI002B415CA4|nr:NAD(P)H-quinone oxidoreductase subunit S, chloroplastic [Humulus lupulus]